MASYLQDLLLINTKSKIMKNLLLSTFIIALLLVVGVTNVNAQTKTKGNATISNNDVKAKPSTEVVAPKVNSTIVRSESNSPNNVVTPQNENSKAISTKKVLKKVNKKPASATPILKTEDTKNN
ncbi:MAG: hypothetical protein CO118_07620 [Flavobacteriales bacterium CG_4_9_14_3_um_filter_32_8]|nr:MAG: hypothetical protein CO118_07620 [Flavobacteriales bacterium CG_4_9_14_3_um_filter_32_8]